MALGDLLWEPADDAAERTRLGRFVSAQGFSDYETLRRWSVGPGLEACWGAIWAEFDVRASEPFEQVLDRRVMPGARWFVGARLNYTTNVLRWADDRPHDVAVVGRSQDRDRIEWTWSELRARVDAIAAELRAAGVRPGDRVAAYLPNVPEAVAAMLATAAIGAVFTSCAPEFGAQAVIDRFGQVEPVVLFAVDRYRYGMREVDRRHELAAITEALPSLRRVVMLDELAVLDRAPGRVDPLPVAPDHPLYVLYSSGTTGLPKPIVHGHGGILLEHLKALGLHGDLGPADRFFWFTTTGWMMWNYLASGLAVGSTIVLFDGDPGLDGPISLWRLAAEERVTWFGVGAPYLVAGRRAGLDVAGQVDTSTIRAVGSTGAPLPPDAFRWVYDSVGSDLLLSPISGGTDVCSAFVGGSPLTPVWEGEIPTRYLGAAVEALDGELVVTRPMPSMPVGFWNDHDGSRYRAAYFEHFPGRWRHGDWLEITERGSCIISGRSDATLNRGGVRVGTAEFYRVVEALPGVADSLIVHVDPDRLVLFVVVDGGVVSDELLDRIREACRRSLSPRHVPDVVHAVAEIPTTLSGKKLEVPVKRILQGADPDVVASRDSLRNPRALDDLIAVAR